MGEQAPAGHDETSRIAPECGQAIGGFAQQLGLIIFRPAREVPQAFEGLHAIDLTPGLNPALSGTATRG